LVRQDIAQDAWTGPIADTVAWWKSVMPDPRSRQARLAPNDAILELFEQLADQPTARELRYLLALLLIRRRVMRHEGTERDEAEGEVIVAYCPRRETTYRVPVVAPPEERMAEIQEQLARLLFPDDAT
jgi:hypothetical protein